MTTDLYSNIPSLLQTAFFGSYSPWLVPFAVFILARFKFSRPYIGYLICAVAGLLLVDLVINPQIFKGTWLDEKLFHGSWFNPNVSSVALALFSFLIPKTLTVEITKFKSIIVSSHYFDFVIFFAVVLSSSIIGLFAFLISIFARNRAWFFDNKVHSGGILLAVTSFLVLNFGHLSKSIEIRLSIWRSALRMLEQHLLYGIGPGKFKQFFLEYREDKLTVIKGRDLIQIDPHNLLLNLLLSFGIFSTLAILSFATFLLTRRKLNLTELESLIIFTFFAQSMINVNSTIVNSFFVFTLMIFRLGQDSASENIK